jgi:C_GCAxxG_C_C family probable redox protein
MAELSDAEKQEILDRVEQKANSYQYEFRGCGQTAFYALQQEFGLSDNQDVFKSASFLGYGIAREMDICGAFMGCILALGLAAGRDNFDDSIYPNPKDIDEKTGLARAAVTIRDFYEKFVEEFGGSTCKAIQEERFARVYNLADPKESAVFSEVHGQDCAEIAGKVARMAAEAILALPRR